MMNDTLQSIKALSEDIRLRLVLLLNGQEACVCELMGVYDMAQSKLSHHLLTLRDAGFLQVERRGKWNYYRSQPAMLRGVNKELVAILARSLEQDGTIERDRTALVKVRQKMNICC